MDVVRGAQVAVDESGLGTTVSGLGSVVGERIPRSLDPAKGSPSKNGLVSKMLQEYARV